MTQPHRCACWLMTQIIGGREVRKCVPLLERRKSARLRQSCSGLPTITTGSPGTPTPGPATERTNKSRRFPPPRTVEEQSACFRVAEHLPSVLLAHFVGDAPSLVRGSCICNESAPALSDCAEAKMSSKQVTLAVGAALFTTINLLVLAANWSITAQAKVAGRPAPEVDADFQRAIRDVVSQMDQSYWRRNNAFRGAVMEVVEKSCRLPYRGSTDLWCRLQSF
jgi:hypothetical protein